MQVSEQIIQVIDTLCAKFGIVMDWSSETIIPLAQTLVSRVAHYEILQSSIALFMYLILIIAPIILVAVSINKDWGDGVTGFCLVLLLFAGITGAVLGCFEACDLIKAITFPELLTLEIIQGFIK